MTATPRRDKPPLLVVVGPTASGKSALSLRLAEQCDGEVVGADSVQIYREFDVGSGKPTPDELARVPHHLVDALDPRAPVDAARFAELADARIEDIRSRGKTPIVCGGTYLWVRALTRGLAAGPPADAAIRERHRQLAEARGRAAVHQELARVDPPSAARLAPNDLVRVSRALEVFALTGTTLSAWHEAHGFRDPRYDARLVGVRWEKAALESRILARVRRMLADGWVEEVRGLLARGLGDARAMKSVGYRQIAAALSRGDIDTEELVVEVDRATRIFARRQRTWLRDEPVRWLDPADVDRVTAREFVDGTRLADASAEEP